MERFGSDFKKVNLDGVLGPIGQTHILKNKSFLLTCTIPIKATTNGTTERQVRIFSSSDGRMDGSTHVTYLAYTCSE